MDELTKILNVKLNQLFYNSAVDPDGFKTAVNLGISPTAFPDFYIGYWYAELMKYYADWFEHENKRDIQRPDYIPYYNYMQKQIPKLRDDIIEKVEMIEKVRNLDRDTNHS